MDIHFPFIGISWNLLCINGAKNCLSAKSSSRLRNKSRISQGSRIDRNFISTCCNHSAYISHATKTTTDAIRKVEFLACSTCHLYRGGSSLMRCGDIKKYHLISTLLVIPLGKLYRISCITQVYKIYSFNNPAIFYVHTGNYSFCKHAQI